MGLKERVKELGDRVKHNQKYLDQEKAARLLRESVGKEYREAPDEVRTDFWCDECGLDISAIGFKKLYSDGMGIYRSKCARQHMLVRYITNKWQDPYWNRSRKVAADREKYADDMLTPDNPRFRIVYPQQWKALQEMKHERSLATPNPES